MKTSAAVSWKRVPLGQCCKVVSGATPRRDEPSFWAGDGPGIDWVTPKDLSNLESPWIDGTPERITEAGYKGCSTTLLPAGSVLLSSRAPIGLLAVTRAEMCTNQGFKSLVPNADIDPLYVYYCLKRDVAKLQAMGRGATFKEVSKPIVESFEIPVPFANGKPDLAEQRRIAAILDKADALRRKAQQALDLTDDLIRSTFLDMFGDPVTNPKGWPTTPLGKCGDFQSGGTPSKARPDFWGGEIPWVSAKDMKREYIEDSQDHISDAALQGTSIKMVPPDALLIVVRGMILAHTLPVALSRRPVTINQDMKAILLGEGHNPEFLFRNLQALAPYLLSKMSTAAHGTKRLEMEVLTSTEMLRPPKPLQMKFADVSAKIQETRLRNTRSLCVAGDLFEATLQRAFTGGL